MDLLRSREPPLLAATSTGRCNTSVKILCWSSKFQGLVPTENQNQFALMQMVTGEAVSQSIVLVAILGIADLPADGPKSSEQWLAPLMLNPKRSRECCECWPVQGFSPSGPTANLR